MNTFAAIIDAFGGPAPYSEAVGVPDSHARTMKARDSIPPAYWPRTVCAATERQIEGVTYEHLARLAEQKALPPATQPAEQGDDQQHAHADGGASADDVQAHEVTS